MIGYCPECGAMLDYGIGSDLEGESIRFPCWCPRCFSEFLECYTLEFSHYEHQGKIDEG